MQILGHRGACADFPENTLEAFAGAMKQGAVGFELDVMQCSSGELIVCHDEKLDRLTGQPIVVADTPWSVLKTLDVGTTLGFPKARIPLLREVFEANPTSIVNVEIKCDDADDRGLSVRVGELLTELKVKNRVFISSFNPQCLLRFAERFPDFKRGYLIDPERPWEPQADHFLPLTAKTSVHPHFTACTAERVNDWHSRGLEVAAWTVNDVAEAKRLQTLGVDWAITNVPAMLIAGLR